MRNLSRAGTFTLVTGLALVLAGCVPQPHPIVPTSQPTVAPVFTSDAAALAAAKKAYEGYLAASDAIGNDGGKDANRIAPWVTTKWLPEELTSYATFAKSGNRFSGVTSYSSFSLEQWRQSHSGFAEVSAYVCADVSKSRLLDPSGRDITPSSRADFVAIQVEFDGKASGSNELLFAGSEPWSGQDFCS